MWLWNVGSSHPCHTILLNYSPPHICTAIILFVNVIAVIVLSSLSPSSCHPFCCFVVIFTLGLEMQSTLSMYTHIIVSIGNEGHKSLSALAVAIITLEVADCNYWYSLVVDGRMMHGSLLDQRIAHPWLLYFIQWHWMNWRCFVKATDIGDIVSAAGYIYW